MTLTIMTVSMRKKHCELGFTHEQVEAEVAKLDPENEKILRRISWIPGCLLPPAWQDY